MGLHSKKACIYCRFNALFCLLWNVVFYMYKAEDNIELCALCGRPLAKPFNKHHLIPKSRGGKHTPTVLLHKICHDKIHSVLTEKELKRYYHTIERIKQVEEIDNFITWVCKKPDDFYDSSVKSKMLKEKKGSKW
jgi:5-methylcytosine-specific restriction endonuclease McrA